MIEVWMNYAYGKHAIDWVALLLIWLIGIHYLLSPR